jgi:hypothetical protein
VPIPWEWCGAARRRAIGHAARQAQAKLFRVSSDCHSRTPLLWHVDADKLTVFARTNNPANWALSGHFGSRRFYRPNRERFGPDLRVKPMQPPRH